MPPWKLVLEIAKKGQRPRPENYQKHNNYKDDDTSASSKDNSTNTSQASRKHNINATPEVQHQFSSSESDSSGNEDDDSGDELELLESPSKKHWKCASVSAKLLGTKQLAML